MRNAVNANSVAATSGTSATTVENREPRTDLPQSLHAEQSSSPMMVQQDATEAGHQMMTMDWTNVSDREDCDVPMSSEPHLNIEGCSDKAIIRQAAMNLKEAIHHHKTAAIDEILGLAGAEAIVSFRDDDGYIALHHAVLTNDGATLAKLLTLPNAKQQTMCKDDAGRIALHHAARLGNTSLADQLLSMPAPDDQLLARDKQGMGALQFACSAGYKPMVDVLLKSGDPAAQLAMQNHGGWNAIMFAVAGSRIGILTRLIAADKTGKHSWLPSGMAIRR